MEFSLGEHQDKHWQSSSIFIADEAFCYIENAFIEVIPGYGHYEMNDADVPSWRSTISKLKTLSAELKAATRFEEVANNSIFRCMDPEFETEFSFYKEHLYAMIDDLAEWAEESLKTNSHIAILGI